MAVPKKKKSKSGCGHKNSHTALKSIMLSFDSEGDLHVRHRATSLPNGGFRYKGKVIVQPKTKEAPTD